MSEEPRVHSQWENHQFFEPKPGAFSQAEDEIIVHALNRLATALPERAESQIAQRLALMVSTRAVHRAVSR